MILEGKCAHTWKLHTPASLKEVAGPIPSYYICDDCRCLLTGPEVFQLEALENQNETLKHIKGFQAYLGALAVAISFIALLVSMFKN
ncbi:MAG: hypothetical protein WBO92_04790 [Candidatus Moraniibacteriota bacterium]